MSTGPTKAELMQQIETLEQTADENRKAAQAWRDHKLSDPEAEAISACVKALDKLRGEESTRWVGRRAADHRRVLRYLADRYNVQWYEPPVEPFTGEVI